MIGDRAKPKLLAWRTQLVAKLEAMINAEDLHLLGAIEAALAAIDAEQATERAATDAAPED